jgi:hypothetical protein
VSRVSRCVCWTGSTVVQCAAAHLAVRWQDRGAAVLLVCEEPPRICGRCTCEARVLVGNQQRSMASAMVAAYNSSQVVAT